MRANGYDLLLKIFIGLVGLEIELISDGFLWKNGGTLPERNGGRLGFQERYKSQDVQVEKSHHIYDLRSTAFQQAQNIDR